MSRIMAQDYVQRRVLVLCSWDNVINFWFILFYELPCKGANIMCSIYGIYVEVPTCWCFSVTYHILHKRTGNFMLTVHIQASCWGININCSKMLCLFYWFSWFHDNESCAQNVKSVILQ
jgi:hypothetical protein